MRLVSKRIQLIFISAFTGRVLSPTPVEEKRHEEASQAVLRADPGPGPGPGAPAGGLSRYFGSIASDISIRCDSNQSQLVAFCSKTNPSAAQSEPTLKA